MGLWRSVKDQDLFQDRMKGQMFVKRPGTSQLEQARGVYQENMPNYFSFRTCAGWVFVVEERSEI